MAKENPRTRNESGEKLMVREGGVEPPHPKAPEPKSGASANSAIPARGFYCASFRLVRLIQNLGRLLTWQGFEEF